MNVLSTDAFEEERFQIAFEGGIYLEHRVEVREGNSRSLAVCMRIKHAYLPYLLSLMRGTVMRPVFAEPREREGR